MMKVQFSEPLSRSSEFNALAKSNKWFMPDAYTSATMGIMCFKTGTVYNNFTRMSYSLESQLLQSIKYVNSDYAKRFHTSTKLVHYSQFIYEMRSAITYVISPESAEILKQYYRNTYAYLANSCYAHIVGINTPTPFALMHNLGSLEPISAVDAVSKFQPINAPDWVGANSLPQPTCYTLVRYRLFAPKPVLLPIPHGLRAHLKHSDGSMSLTWYRTDEHCGYNFLEGIIDNNGNLVDFRHIDGDLVCREMLFPKKCASGIKQDVPNACNVGATLDAIRLAVHNKMITINAMCGDFEPKIAYSRKAVCV